MLVALLIISVYITFNEKNINEEDISFQGVDNTCFFVENGPLQKEKFYYFNFSGIITDQNFSWLYTLRLKKLMDDDIFPFKLRPENEKLFQNFSFQNFENILSVSRKCNIYLYLKKLLI